MTEDIIKQSTALLEGIFLGLATGVLYDMMRVLRARVKIPLLGHFLDLLFWFLVTFTIFVWSQQAWGGRIRLYGVLALTLGAVLYFFTFTAITQWIGFCLADFTQFLAKVIWFPVASMICLEKKFKKILKNLFLFWQKWYRINSVTKEMAQALLPSQNQKGGVGLENQTSRACHKDRRHRGDDISGGGIAYGGGGNPNHKSGQPATARRSAGHVRSKQKNAPRPRI